MKNLFQTLKTFKKRCYSTGKRFVNSEYISCVCNFLVLKTSVFVISKEYFTKLKWLEVNALTRTLGNRTRPQNGIKYGS